MKNVLNILLILLLTLIVLATSARNETVREIIVGKSQPLPKWLEIKSKKLEIVE